MISKSEETLAKIKNIFKCEKCSVDLKPFDKFKYGKYNDQVAKSKIENKAESNTFNRLQKIVNDCSKPKLESGSKKYQYSIENKGVLIKRSKPHPEMEEFDLKKFKLVELHMNEAPIEDFNSIKEWTLIRRTQRNCSLESKMARRNNEKIAQLKQTINSDILLKFSKKNLFNDMCMLMNYDFCNNRYGFKSKKPKNLKKKVETNKNLICNDKKEDLMMELYGFETENKENETKHVGDDLYDDLNDNPVMDLNEFNFEKYDVKTPLEKDNVLAFKKEEKKFSNKTEFKNLELEKNSRQDAYSRRKAHERDFSKSINRRSRSSSRTRKRSRSRSTSRSSSNSKRRELNKTYDDRKDNYKYHSKHKNYYK